jgi:hypothetical protein
MDAHLEAAQKALAMPAPDFPLKLPPQLAASDPFMQQMMPPSIFQPPYLMTQPIHFPADTVGPIMGRAL